MRYELRVTAYDMLDQIHITAALQSREGFSNETVTTVHRFTTTLAGTGEQDARRWAGDALIALLETL